MQINVLFIIVLLILIGYGIKGFKTGIVEGVTRVISYILGVIVLGILFKLVGSFAQKDWITLAILVVGLWIIRTINKLINLLLDSLKIVSKLPLVSSVNKIAGIAFGVIRGICFTWIVFAVFNYIDIFNISQWMNAQISENTYLKIISESNLILRVIGGIV